MLLETTLRKGGTDKSMVLVTGATGGLGKAFAVECASRGWDVFLTDLRADLLESLAGGLRTAYGVRVITHASDLTDSDSRAGLFARLHVERLRFWGLINVAGIDFEGPFFEQTSHQIQTIIRLNVEGTLDMTRGLLELRDPLSTFRIINVASLAAFCPMPVKATYAASKRFLMDFSLALREELRGLGATVTVLCPAGMPNTLENIQAIEAQGWIGQITTQDAGSVANAALDYALAGKAVYIPGMVNRVLQLVGSLTPAPLIAALIGSRWKAARQRRGLQVSAA